MISNIKKAINSPGLILPYFIRWISTVYIKKIKGSTAFSPNTIKLIINSTCNCSCDFCDVGTKTNSMFYTQMVPKEKSLLTIATLNKFLAEFKSIKPFISICGVEPLLHPDIITIIENLESKGFPTSIITNGVLLPKYASEFARIGVRIVKVSVDGPEELHDSFRGNGVYKKAMLGLQILNDAKIKYNSKTKTVINFTISNANYKNIETFATDVLEKGIAQEIKFNYLFFTSTDAAKEHNKNFSFLGAATPTNYQKQFMVNIDTNSIVDQLLELKNKFDKKIIFNEWLTHKQRLNSYYNKPNERLGNFSCQEPWTGTTVLANGDVVISNRCFVYKTGNIKTQSFKEIWNNKRYKTFRKTLKEAGRFPACERCGGIFYS